MGSPIKKMSNVFTRKSGLPRTTTLKDFRDPEFTNYLANHYNPNRKAITRTQSRPRSPTRLQNPQPTGLIYQQPYNRYGQMFGIWHPVYQGSKRDKCRQFEYTNRINFTCDHDIDMYKERKEPVQRTNSLKQQC